MTNLIITLLILLPDNLMEVRLVAPFSGRLTAHVTCSLNSPWQPWANKLTVAGTNSFVMKRPCSKDGFVRLYLQPE